MDKVEEKKRSLPLGSIFAIAVKYTKVLKFFQLIKLLKFSKIFLSFGTMVLSIFVYSYSLGLLFSIGFVLMLFVHEMGHVVALWKKGYKSSAPIFIPMLGAVIFSPDFNNSEEEAFVGYGGPFVGGLAALAAFGVWLALPGKHDVLLSVSYFAAFLNLFNLIPIRPMDGGRITQVIGSKFKWVGFAALLGFSLLIKQPSILLIWILVLEDFNIKPPIKFGAGLTSLLSMAMLFILGYGNQPIWINILDCMLGSLFVYFMYMQLNRYNKSNIQEVADLPLPIRLKWLGLYSALVIGLTGLMLIQGSYLPILAKH